MAKSRLGLACSGKFPQFNRRPGLRLRGSEGLLVARRCLRHRRRLAAGVSPSHNQVRFAIEQRSSGQQPLRVAVIPFDYLELLCQRVSHGMTLITEHVAEDYLCQLCIFKGGWEKSTTREARRDELDLVLAKYTAAGAHLWSKHLGGTGGQPVRTARRR